jgi:class 3 adenylate cyclase
MPIYMDRHDIQGATPEAVAGAHQEDLKCQSKYGVRPLTYWFDASRGAAFCLVEAPAAKAVEALHREAHGQVPSEIIEVNPGAVEAFLGRIGNPREAENRPLEDSAFRAIMFTDMHESTHLALELGDDGLMPVLHAHNRIIRDALKNHQGREVKHTGDGIMASFVSVARAVECAIEIQRCFASYNTDARSLPIHVRIGLSAGEPVAEDQDLFGSTVNLAARLCSHAEPDRILVAHVVRELCLGKNVRFDDKGEVRLKGFSEPVRFHEVRWHKA